MKMKFIVILSMLLFAAPALADSDNWLRSQVRELTAKVEKNSSQVQTLTQQNQKLNSQVQALTKRVQYLEQISKKK